MVTLDYSLCDQKKRWWVRESYGPHDNPVNIRDITIAPLSYLSANTFRFHTLLHSRCHRFGDCNPSEGPNCLRRLIGNCGSGGWLNWPEWTFCIYCPEFCGKFGTFCEDCPGLDGKLGSSWLDGDGGGICWGNCGYGSATVGSEYGLLGSFRSHGGLFIRVLSYTR